MLEHTLIMILSLSQVQKLIFFPQKTEMENSDNMDTTTALKDARSLAQREKPTARNLTGSESVLFPKDLSTFPYLLHCLSTFIRGNF